MPHGFRSPVRLIRQTVVGLAVCLMVEATAEACCYVSWPSRTLSQRFAEAERLLLVKLLETREATESKAASTTYEVVEVIRDSRKTLHAGQKIAIPGSVLRKPGTLSLLWEVRNQGIRPAKPDWSIAEETTAEQIRYLREAALFTPDHPDRLSYFAKFLEHSDRIIAQDAFQEFAEAPPQQVIRIARKFPPQKLREWLFGEKTQLREPYRGLYATMLGWCGDQADAERLKAEIFAALDEDEFRIGIDGYITGYLLLTGVDGLPSIEQSKLAPKNLSFSETYSAIRALRYLREYGERRIPDHRLKQSLTLLLDHPDVAELAVVDLARWKDWEIGPRLFKLYGGEGEFNSPRFKKAVIQFLLASVHDLPGENASAAATPEHILRDRALLAKIREREPELVSRVERQYLIPTHLGSLVPTVKK